MKICDSEFQGCLVEIGFWPGVERSCTGPRSCPTCVVGRARPRPAVQPVREAADVRQPIRIVQAVAAGPAAGAVERAGRHAQLGRPPGAASKTRMQRALTCCIDRGFGRVQALDLAHQR